MVAKSLELRTVCRWGLCVLFLVDRAVQVSETYENFGTRFHHTGVIRGGAERKTSLLSHFLTPLLEEEEVSHFALLTIKSSLSRTLLWEFSHCF